MAGAAGPSGTSRQAGDPSRSPWRPFALLRRALAALALFVLFAWPWPHVGEWASSAMRFACEATFGGISRGHVVLVQARADVARGWDTIVIVARADRSRAFEVPCSLRSLGVIPLAAWLALVVVVPATWRQRWRIAWSSALAMLAFVLARLGLVMLHALTRHAEYCTDRHAQVLAVSWWRDVLDVARMIVLREPLVNVLVPIAIVLVATWAWRGSSARGDTRAT